MDLFETALEFATWAHSGQRRKMSNIPYILHPMEVASIAATMTNDTNVLCAALLHDTVEDCHITSKALSKRFGERVCWLVAQETEKKYPDEDPSATWVQRKQESLDELKNATDLDVKILWLSDKLSNIRSFYDQYRKKGDEMWLSLHQHDVKLHKWYYTTIAEYTKELEDFTAYQEYVRLVGLLFGKEA